MYIQNLLFYKFSVKVKRLKGKLYIYNMLYYIELISNRIKPIKSNFDYLVLHPIESKKMIG